MKRISGFMMALVMSIVWFMPQIFAYQSLIRTVILIPPESPQIQATSKPMTTAKGTTYDGRIGNYVAAPVTIKVVPTISVPGKYKVEMWNMVADNNAPAKSITIYGYNEQGTFDLPNKTGEERFYDMGTYTFLAGNSGYIEIILESGLFRYDYFRFTLVEEMRELVDENKEQPDVLSYPTTAKEVVKTSIEEKEVSVPTPKENAMKIYVESGKNGNGTKENPFGTIKEAQQYAREIASKKYPEGGICVYIKGGTYVIDETIQFTEADSGRVDNPIIYKGYDGEVNLVFGVVVDKNKTIKIADDVYENLPPEGKENAVAIDLKACGLENIKFVDSANIPFILSDGEKTYGIARYPNGTGQGKLGIIEEWGTRSNVGPRRLRGPTYSVSNARQLRWADELNPMLSGFYGPEYSRLETQISEIDTKDMSLSVKENSYIKPAENAPYYAYNLLTELDYEGEFYVDTEKCILYYYPYKDSLAEEMFLSVKEDDVINIINAHDISMQNINIVCGGGNGVVFSETTTRCSFMGGDICGLPKIGAYIRGNNNIVRDCDIYNLGNNAINISGGDPKKYIKSNNIAENNICTRAPRTGSGGCIQLKGCGNIVRNNYIHTVPDKAINMSDCGNIVKWNRIERTNLENSDTGAIYFINYGMGYGTEISHNYIRDTYTCTEGFSSSEAIYPDDYTCGTTIIGNVIVNSRRTGICLRGANMTVDNNLIIKNDNNYYNGGTFNTGPGNVFRDSFDDKGTTRYERNIMSHDIENVPEYAAAKADLESGEQCGVVRNLTCTNNATFVKEEFFDAYMAVDQKILNKFAEYNSTYDGSHWFKGDVAENLITLEDINYDKIREKIPGFKDLEVEKMGVYCGGLRTDKEIEVTDSAAEEFSIIGPENGAEGLNNIVTLSWDDLANTKGYEKSTVYIATNPEMTENLISFQTIECSEELECDYGKTYYWMVVGTEMKTGDLMGNKGGVHSFTTISAQNLFENKLFTAKAYIKETQNGEYGGMYSQEAKQKLMDVVAEYENKTYETSEEWLENLDIIDGAIEEYRKSRNVPEEDVNYVYYDFQTDCIGQSPYPMYYRAGAYTSQTVEQDPVNPLNKAVRFKDVNIDGFAQVAYKNSFNTCNALMSFKRQTEGVVTFRSSVMPDSDAKCFSMALGKGQARDITDGSPSTDNILSVNFSDDGWIYADKNKEYPCLQWEAMKWYDIKAVLDCEKNTYDVYIDGAKYARNIPAYMDVSEVSVGQIRFSTTDGTINDEITKQTGTYWLDNVIVSAKCDKGSNPYLFNMMINGKQIDGFLLDTYAYFVEMSDEEFENMMITYEADSDANVSVWHKDNVKYVVVVAGDGSDAVVYNVINRKLGE